MHRVLKILPSAAVSESKYLPKRPILPLKKKKKCQPCQRESKKIFRGNYHIPFSYHYLSTMIVIEIMIFYSLTTSLLSKP